VAHCNGNSLNIWDSRWIPRSSSFQVITPQNLLYVQIRVCDRIDTHNAAWHATLVENIFLHVDAAIILDIPFCASWPEDKLVWHYTSDGSFTVRSAYHTINMSKCTALGSSSRPSRGVWRTVWSLRIPPCLKLFGWRLCKGIIPYGYNIA